MESKKLTYLVLFTSVLSLLFSICTHAQQQSDVSSTPRKAMQSLSVMQGEWESTMSISYDMGSSWQSKPSNKVRVDSKLNGMVLEQRNLTPSHNGWSIIVNTAYDQYRQQYRHIVMDDVWGMMDVYEGNLDEQGNLVVNNLDSETFFPGINNTWLAFRLVIELSECERQTRIQASPNNGETWIPYIRYNFVNTSSDGCKN